MTAKTKKIIDKVFSITWWGLFLSLFAVVMGIVVAKAQGKVPKLFGYSVMNIISGSMEDEIPKDSYILIKRQDAESVKKNDIICFYSSDPKIYGMPNTHRVVEDPIITDEGIEFITRGDANEINDKVTAKGDRLIGVYVKKLDTLTAFVNLLQGKTLIIVIICLQIAMFSMFAYTYYTAKVKQKDSDEKNESEKNEGS